MKQPDITRKNLLALSVSHPLLAQKLNSVDPSPLVSFTNSRNQHIVPQLRLKERLISLHSLFDPVREGRRMVENCGQGGFMVVFGFGAGFHVLPLLENPLITQILILEKNLDFFKAIMDRVDLIPFLTDRRISFLIDPSPDDLQSFILSHFIPAIHGDLHTMVLRARRDTTAEFFPNLFTALKEVLDQVRGDYSVQAHFGKRWFFNSIINLQQAEKSSYCLDPVKKVMVIAAGPSLDQQMDQLIGLKEECLLIATDSSLSTLEGYGIKPDLVISIDCQHISYHHFLKGIAKDIPLVLDLASPPFLARLTEKPVFFSSGHPFAGYITKNWRLFPQLDTSGGNVTHTAVHFAYKLGAQEIYLFGADYSYPQGKTYAKGAYVDCYFRNQANKLNPFEKLSFSFIMDRKDLIRYQRDSSITYTTATMLNYKNRLKEAAKSLDTSIIPIKGMGETLHFPSPSGPHAKTDEIFSSGYPKSPWKRFLRDYRQQIADLPLPFDPIARYFFGLNQEQKELWLTLYPLTAALKESGELKPAWGSSILQATRQWALRFLKDYLKRS